MTRRAPGGFDAQDLTIAVAVALLAQLGFLAVFSLPSPELVQADITNDNARPIAVAITPVLKLGSKTPDKLPSTWRRKAPAAAKVKPPAPAPSPLAEKTLDATPKSNVPDAATPFATVDAGRVDPNAASSPVEAGAVTTASSTQGSEQGAANGTETDPLKARAADMYRAQLASWFASQFQIRGKVPFDTLKTLHAVASVTVTPDRRLAGFTVVKPSGNTTFDEEVQATLLRIQSSGVELPAPPPLYPEMLGKNIPVGFQCTIERACE